MRTGCFQPFLNMDSFTQLFYFSLDPNRLQEFIAKEKVWNFIKQAFNT